MESSEGLAEWWREDRNVMGIGMAICAAWVNYAVNLADGDFSRGGIIAITLAILFASVTILLPIKPRQDARFGRLLPIILLILILYQLILLFDYQQKSDGLVRGCIAGASLFAVAQIFELGEYRWYFILGMIAFFLIAVIYEISQNIAAIDVWLFQGCSSLALLSGKNPYAVHYVNIYAPDTPFYGKGVVDSTGDWLNYSFPYPPMTLLIAALGCIFGRVVTVQARAGRVKVMDCRRAQAASAGASAFLISQGRATRVSALAAALFLLSPRGLWVPFIGWTEPILALTFSLAMFCAIRNRKLLPWALGLYFATKQYTVLSLPALWLLTDPKDRIRSLWAMMWRAGLVVAVVTLPFVFWNPAAFFRSVVQWQFVQPFRSDALSFLVLYYKRSGIEISSKWIPLAAIVPAIALTLWRCPRTPSGFAAAVTLIHIVFFAFNKQAFANYYYFVAATACWVAAALPEQAKQETVESEVPIVVPGDSVLPAPA